MQCQAQCLLIGQCPAAAVKSKGSQMSTHLDGPEQRQVLSRFFFSFLTALIIVLGFTAPETVTYHVVKYGGVSALANSLVLLVCSVVAWLDVVLNDILPPRFSFYFDRRQRHLVWGVMGIAYLGHSFILARLDSSFLSVGIFTVLGVWASSIAAMDVVYELLARCRQNGKG